MGEAKCGHAVAYSDSQLHGVCIFCYRDRLGECRARVAALEAERDELRAALERYLSVTDADGEEAPPHDCEFARDPEKGVCEFHEAWGELRAFLRAPSAREEAPDGE